MTFSDTVSRSAVLVSSSMCESGVYKAGLFERLSKRVTDLEGRTSRNEKGKIYELTPAPNSKSSGYIPIALDVVLYQFHDIN